MRNRDLVHSSRSGLRRTRCRLGSGTLLRSALLVGVVGWWVPAVRAQAPASTDRVLATFARGQWDSTQWIPVRLPHQPAARALVQRDSSVGTDAFAPEETKNGLDNVILVTDTGVTDGEIEVSFSLSDVKGTAPGLCLAPLIKDGVIEKAFTLFVASYTMAFWRAETDPQTGKTAYAHLARVVRWNEPNRTHVLRCRFSQAQKAIVVRLDDGDPIMFKDFGVDVNSWIGVWGCHGPCDFYTVRLLAKPTLEWSASPPTTK